MEECYPTLAQCTDRYQDGCVYNPDGDEYCKKAHSDSVVYDSQCFPTRHQCREKYGSNCVRINGEYCYQLDEWHGQRDCEGHTYSSMSSCYAYCDETCVESHNMYYCCDIEENGFGEALIIAGSVLFFILLIVVIAICCCRRKKAQKRSGSQQVAIQLPQLPQAAPQLPQTQPLTEITLPIL